MNPFQFRLKTIEDNLNRNIEMLSQCESQLVFAGDPVEKGRLKQQITLYKQLIEEQSADWEKVNQKVQALVANDTVAPASGELRSNPKLTLEMHFTELSDLLLQSKVIPVLGAGVNLSNRSAGSKWQPDQSFLPSPIELAAYLAENFQYPLQTAPDLAQVSQYASVVRSPGRLYERLRSLLGADYPPTTVHQFFAALPRLLREKAGPDLSFPVIITTNYDNLLEKAFDQAHEPYDLLSYVAEGEYRNRFIHLPPGSSEWLPITNPNRYSEVKPELHPVIIKVNGLLDRLDAARDNLVITEDDFINYMARSEISGLIPFNLMVRLQRHSLLFMGYNPAEWNYRVLLHRLWEQRRNPYDSWTVESDAPEWQLNFWQKWNIKVVPADLATYTVGLKAYLESLPATREGSRL